MFLFVSRTVFKQAGLFAALLLPLTAHAADVTETSADDAQPDAPLNVQLQQAPVPDAGAKNHRFPHWPHHMQASKTIIPPPPPGPYKSSALNDYVVSVPPQRSAKRPPPRQTVGNDSAAVPMDMFSPDIPWPSNLRPERQTPEHRVANSDQYYARPQMGRPQAMLRPPHASPMMKQGYGHYNYAQRQDAYPNAPYMNDMGRNNMGMRGSRWMPDMTMAPPGPYNSRWNNNRWNYAPNFSPDGRSNHRQNYEPQGYGPRYARPPVNNSSSGAVNSAYR